MKKLSLVLGSCVLALSAAQATADVTANVAMTTDYVWRGMTQTDNDPALQGGFDYSHEAGFYTGIWASNVDFGTSADLEVDLYGGYATEFSNGVGLDVGAIRYMYPDAADTSNWNEIYANASFIGLSAGIAFSDDVYGSDEDGTYYSLGYDYALTMDLGLSASVGYYDIDMAQSDSVDWKLGLSGEFEGVGLELAYFDINHDDSTLDDDGVIFTLSKSL
uniref:TorF family putative porin n=1 Tax=Marinobacterium profundum TaxID=1714300 RepID=UPI0008356814|nr:TorF family putative porin [Marinobacterium profundum]